MKPAKPRAYLSLLRFAFPLNAILSITHRVTGIIIFISLLLTMTLLTLSLEGSDFLLNLLSFFQTPYGKAILSLALISLLFHWLAGIRHLITNAKLEWSEPDKVKATAYQLLVVWTGLSASGIYWIWW